MKIERKTVYTAELTTEQVGVIAYVLGNCKNDDLKGTAHAHFADGGLGALYSMFNDAWCSGK